MDRWFYDRARAGEVIHSSNITPPVTTGLAATHTGLVLSNRVGSGKFAVVKDFEFAASAAAGGVGTVGLCTGPSANSTNVVHTTPCVIHNAIEAGSNNNTGLCLVDESATLPDTPVALYARLGYATVVGTAQMYILFNGTLILRPGTYIATYFLTNATTGLGSFTWAEINQF